MMVVWVVYSQTWAMRMGGSWKKIFESETVEQLLAFGGDDGNEQLRQRRDEIPEREDIQELRDKLLTESQMWILQSPGPGWCQREWQWGGWSNMFKEWKGGSQGVVDNSKRKWWGSLRTWGLKCIALGEGVWTGSSNEGSGGHFLYLRTKWTKRYKGGKRGKRPRPERPAEDAAASGRNRCGGGGEGEEGEVTEETEDLGSFWVGTLSHKGLL